VRNEYKAWLEDKESIDSSYKTCKETKSQIDELLRENSSLQASLGKESTKHERLIVEEKTNDLMLKIKQIDEGFYEIIKVN
tara:strand:- start:331 stop:573 length:243 start_codon:yes stop_codon:yes gene_type:complete